MTELVLPSGVSLREMSDTEVSRVKALENEIIEKPQVELEMDHVIHGGMYARTCYVPAGVVFTGALIKIPTMVIVSGDVSVFVGDNVFRLGGYFVLPANTGRKQAFVAHADSTITMIFPTSGKTVEECEAEFTDEADRLMSRGSDHNHVLVTG